MSNYKWPAIISALETRRVLDGRFNEFNVAAPIRFDISSAIQPEKITDSCMITERLRVLVQADYSWHSHDPTEAVGRLRNNQMRQICCLMYDDAIKALREIMHSIGEGKRSLAMSQTGDLLSLLTGAN